VPDRPRPPSEHASRGKEAAQEQVVASRSQGGKKLEEESVYGRSPSALVDLICIFGHMILTALFLCGHSLFCPATPVCLAKWLTSYSTNRCRQTLRPQPSLVVRQNACLFLSFSPLFLHPHLISPILQQLIPRQQGLQLILYHLFLLVLLVFLNMNSCLFYPQSVRGGLVIIHKRTVILSFLHAVLHPWVAQSPGQIL
jgi:hypothetical protein